MAGDFLTTYPGWLDHLKGTLEEDAALRMAVGDSFIAAGKMEYALLRHLGLKENSFVVDVGCGSGRLASQLARHPEIRYAGTDVVPQLLDYARRLSGRSDWTFTPTKGKAIPVASSTADFVCFFSVFTHLKHEETFVYLNEAKRALRDGGLIVFSFLEFRIPFHWMIFEYALGHTAADPLTQFMDRDGIAAFAAHLDLEVVNIWDGGVPHIPIDEEIVWDDGRRQVGLGDLGQSIAVLRCRK